MAPFRLRFYRLESRDERALIGAGRAVGPSRAQTFESLALRERQDRGSIR